MKQAEAFLAEKELGKVIEIMQQKFSFDLSGYSKTSLRRRFYRIFQLYDLGVAADFELFLQRRPEHLNKIIEEFTVNTTEMFRDPEFWLHLRNELPLWAEKVPTLRVWHAGCSSGEEVYSMLILLEELKLLGKTRLFASDINNYVLSNAKSGKVNIKDVPAFSRNYSDAGGSQNFESYFEKKEHHFFLKRPFLNFVTFKKHNLACDLPFSKFDLILCRNVMIYFEQELQCRVIGLFNNSLFNNGLLALGKKETLNFIDNGKTFEPLCYKERIYRKKD